MFSFSKIPKHSHVVSVAKLFGIRLKSVNMRRITQLPEAPGRKSEGSAESSIINIFVCFD